MYSTQVLITPPKLKRTLEITVTDGTDPISGATVTINSTDKTTNASGKAEFELYEGDYTVTATKTNYTTASDTVDLNEHNTTLTLELEVTDTITITIDDGDDTPTAIEGAKVIIGETEKTTDSNGQCTFTEMTYDDYDVTVVAEGYDDEEETIQFRSNHKSFTISLTATTENESEPEGDT